MIIEHLEAINSIALSLNHKSLRWVTSWYFRPSPLLQDRL